MHILFIVTSIVIRFKLLDDGVQLADTCHQVTPVHVNEASLTLVRPTTEECDDEPATRDHTKDKPSAIDDDNGEYT